MNSEEISGQYILCKAYENAERIRVIATGSVPFSHDLRQHFCFTICLIFSRSELYDYCLKENIADKNLIAKWKKQGYENLCCLRCIQSRDTNFGSNCICRVPKAKLEEVCWLVVILWFCDTDNSRLLATIGAVQMLAENRGWRVIVCEGWIEIINYGNPSLWFWWWTAKVADNQGLGIMSHENGLEGE